MMLPIYFVLSGCSEDSTGPEPEPSPVLIPVEVDSIWVLGSERMQRVAVSVSPVEAAAGQGMVCLISGSAREAEFRLYDDGGYGRWDDALNFADSLSGDHNPLDGVFTRRINARFAEREGDFKFLFALTSPADAESLGVKITVRRNSPPVFASVTVPDSVPSGSRGLPFTAVVHDPDGDGDIASVELLHLERLGVSYPMERRDDSTWLWLSEPSLAARLATGMYPFKVRMSDFYMKQTGDWVESDTVSCWFENLPPRVEVVEGFDTVWVSPLDTVLFDYLISVTDDQGLTDLDSLLLTISRPDDVDPDSSVMVFRGFYFDDGTGLDTTAGDGRYVAGFSADSSSRIGVPFTFAWTPTDHSPQRGETYYTTLVILERRACGPTPAFVGTDYSGIGRCHTRAGGNPDQQKLDWIPAFAGMTDYRCTP